MSAGRGLRLLDGGHPLEARLLAATTQARNESVDALAHLLGFDLAEWLATDRDRRPVRSTADTGGLGALDIARVIASVLIDHDLGDLDATATTARLVRTAGGVDRDQVPTGPEVRRRAATGEPLRVVPAGLEAALAAGHSFKLRALELASTPLERLVEDIERVAGVPSGLMGYLSGAGARGWGAHYDRHDGIVIQIEGTKRWVVYEPVEPRPLRPASPYEVTDRVAWAGELAPGDVLAVPRGWGHEVSGTDERSLHLTVPVRQPDASQVVQAAIVGREPDPIAAVLAAQRAAVPSRSRLSLSRYAEVIGALTEGRPVPWPADARVRVSAPGGVVALGPIGSLVAWVVAGRHLRADRVTTEILAELLTPTGADPSTAALSSADATAAMAGLLQSGLAEIAVPTHLPAGPPPTTPPVAPVAPVAPRETIPEAFRAGLVPGAASTRVGGPPNRDVPVRLPDPTSPSEASSAAAITTARNQAADALARAIPDLDLVSLVARPREARPRRAALAPAWPGLIGPEVVDDLLATRDLSGGRLAVAHGGVAFNRRPPEDLYRPSPDPAAPVRIDAARLVDFLGRGATAIAFGIDDSCPPLSRLAELIERTAGVRSGVNLYLSHGCHRSGFGPHWDDHDVLVLQAVGTKRWQLHPPSEPSPVLHHSPPSVTGPASEEAVLEPGSVLYVPRGWGHTVTGCDGLSAHYTFPIRVPTGAAVLAELAAMAARDPGGPNRFSGENTSPSSTDPPQYERDPFSGITSSSNTNPPKNEVAAPGPFDPATVGFGDIDPSAAVVLLRSALARSRSAVPARPHASMASPLWPVDHPGGAHVRLTAPAGLALVDSDLAAGSDPPRRRVALGGRTVDLSPNEVELFTALVAGDPVPLRSDAVDVGDELTAALLGSGLAELVPGPDAESAAVGAPQPQTDRR